MAPVAADKEKTEKLTEEQKRAILEGYNEALRGEVVDALTAIEEIRVRHGL